jgi:parallel beta-helix repeat protein
MHRIKSRVVLFLLVIGVIFTIQLTNGGKSHSNRNIPFADGGVERDYDVYFDKSTPAGIRFTFQVRNYMIGTDNIEGETASEISMQGANKNRTPGNPTTPIIYLPIAIPDCDDIELTYQVIKENNRKNIDLEQWVTKDRHLNSQRSQNMQENRNSRKTLVSIERITSIRNQKVAIVAISPFAYQKRSKNLNISEEIEVSLNPINPRGAVHVNAGPMESLVRRNMANGSTVTGPFQAETSGPPVLTVDRGAVTWCGGNNWRDAADSVITVGTDYLIVAIENLSDSLVQELAEHRANSSNFNVSIVTMDQIDSSPDTVSTPDTLRAFIKRVYDGKCATHIADSLLAYVLLLGDAAEPDGDVLLPGYYGWGGALKSSDAYYSFLSEASADNDFFADVYIGRIPVDVVSGADPEDPDWELDNVVQKITNYQPGSLENKKILMVSGDAVGVMDPLREYFPYVTDKYIPGFIDGDTVVVDTLNRDDYPGRDSYDITFGDIVTDRLEANEHWIMGLLNHGSPYYLGSSYFPSNYDLLENDNPWPLVVTSACQMGHFDIEIDPEEATFPPDGWACLDTAASTPYGIYTPTTELDFCDAFGERMVLMENGAIGVIAYTRNGTAMENGSLWSSYFKSIFENNAFSLGEILLSTRFYMFPDDGFRIQRALTVFGDPALNIVWENYGDASVDSTDLAVTNRSISFPDAVKGRYIGTDTSIDIRISVQNNWHEDASQVPIAIWDGDPSDGSSSLLARDTLATVPGYGNAITTVDIGTLTEGEYNIYVKVDTTGYTEPSYYNNQAFRLLRVNDYKTGYPVELKSTGTHSVTVAEVNSSHSGTEILVNTAYALTCWSADGDSIWSKQTTTYGDFAGFMNGTPLVADVYNNGENYCLFLDSLLYIIDGDTGLPADTVTITGSNYTLWALSNQHGQTMTVADIYPGGGAEVMFARREWSGSLDPDDGLYISCYDIGSGQQKWENKIGSAYEAYAPTEFSIGDSDGDGVYEIGVRTTGQTTLVKDSIYVFNNNGERKWVDELGTHGVYSVAEIALIPAGVDDDDNIEMDLLCTNILNNKLLVHKYNSTGTDTSWTIATIVEDPYFSVGDVDNDGTLEIVLSYIDITANKSVLKIVSSSDGTVEDSLVVDYKFRVVPLLVDLDEDSYSEIVLVADDQVKKESINSRYLLQIRDHDLDLVTQYSFPYDRDESADLYGSAYVMGSMPAIEDVDADGVVEIAFVSPDSVLHLIELGASENTEWAQRFQNPAQLNNYRQLVGGEYEVDFSVFGEVEVLTDAKFREKVYFTPGARMLIADDDEGDAGVDTAAVEIHVYGVFEAEGTEADPIRFVAWDGQDESTTQDDWWGIFVHDDSSDASASFEYCEIKNAKTAIGTNVPITIKNCTIELCDLIGISIASVDSDSVHVEDTIIRDTDVVGINLLQSSTARVTGCTVENMDSYGIEVYSNAKLYIDDSEIKNCDTGIYVWPGDSLVVSAEIVDCDLISNDIGIWVYDTDDVSVDSCVVDSNSTNGIYCLDGASIDIEDNTIRYNTIGIFCNDNSDAVIKDNTIRYNSSALKCDDYSDAVVEGNVITSNTGGVFALNSSDPDLGHASGGSSVGDNSIHSTTNLYVSNLTIGVTIKAENNYWGVTRSPCEPRAYKFYGSVDYSPALCSAPSSSSYEAVGMELTNLPKAYNLGQNYPNPFNPTTSIQYQVPPPGGRVSLSIYNVKGQRIMTLVDSHKVPGYHSVEWSGINTKGSSVASGVYFIQMKAPGFVKTKKLLLLK